MRIDYRYFSVIDSTNEEAKRVAKLSSESLQNQAIVFVSDTQTAGRGTHGKRWESDSAGGLYYTLLISQPEFDFERVEYYLKGIALAVVKTIRIVAGIYTEVEWPNDIILDQKKCAGILLETASQAHSKNPHYVMIGIGLNLNQTSFSPELTPIAISLRQKTQQHYDKNTVIHTLTKELLAWQYEAFEVQSPLKTIQKKTF